MAHPRRDKAFEPFNRHIKTAEQRTIIQQYGDWYTLTPPRSTKCNSPPINSQCTNFVLFDVAL